ncbi:hypothetical protein SDC9_82743 [bioreactor metagenome]|uniref:Uncharacterized protein n=1 Tax=bioreactor metagenome TaxID=1076179 RepID=A0A644Z792_9ZZZZ
MTMPMFAKKNTQQQQLVVPHGNELLLLRFLV